MQITRQHFLATTRLPGNQHRAVTARHPRRQLQQLPTAGLDRNRAVIFLQLAACMTCHLLQQLTRLEGFDQIILRTLALTPCTPRWQAEKHLRPRKGNPRLTCRNRVLPRRPVTALCLGKARWRSLKLSINILLLQIYLCLLPSQFLCPGLMQARILPCA